MQVIGSTPKDLVIWHFPFALLVWLLARLRIRLPDRLLPKHVRALRQCDLLLDVSGISFSDGREKYLPYNILRIWPALLLGVPVINLAQALGPFKNPLVRLSARLFLPRCARIYARGAVTAEHLRDLGLPADRWERADDVAFLYKPEYSLSAENDALIDMLGARLDARRAAGDVIVGLVPSSLVLTKVTKTGRDYLAVLLDVVHDLGAGYHFIVLPNATRQGRETATNNDLWAIAQLKARAAATLTPEELARIDMVDVDVNTAGTRRLIARCDVLLTSRFHGMISALCLGVPPVVVGWSHKYAEVLAEFDLARYAVDFADAEADVAALVREVLAQREALRAPMAAGLARARESSARQFEALARWLG